MADVIMLDSADARSVLVGASCAFGVFDGVHKGHRYLINQALDTASKAGGRAVVLTFDIDPDELFHPKRLHKLLSNEERLAMLSEIGVDAVAVLRFDRAFASLLPEEFLDVTFAGNLPACIHVGCDIRFGSKASGNLQTLEQWGGRNGVRIVGHDLLTQDGKPITATRIRLLLEKGDDGAACSLLGR